MKKIAVLISGGGRTLKNLQEKIAAGTLPAEIALVVSSSSTSAGLGFAAEAGIPAEKFLRGGYASDEAYSEAIFARCREFGVELVVLAGWLKKLVIPEDFLLKVVNIHPSLIPAFCGHGFYGHHVHEAAIAYGVKISGCTVHFVTNEYDQGPILVQKAVPVLETDTPDTLAARVFEQELLAFPEALQLLAEGRVSVIDGVARIRR